MFLVIYLMITNDASEAEIGTEICLPVCLSFTNNLNKWKWSWCRRKKRKTLSISVWPNFCTCDEVYFQHFRIRYLCNNQEKAPQRQICLSFTYLLYVIAIIFLLLYFLFKERRTFGNQKLTSLVTFFRSTPLTARTTFNQNSKKMGLNLYRPSSLISWATLCVCDFWMAIWIRDCVEAFVISR